MAPTPVRNTKISAEMLCITVGGISHDNHRKCRLSSFNGIAFLPRRVIDAQQPSIHTSMVKSADKITDLDKWLGRSKYCYTVETMVPLLRNVQNWISLGDIDLSLHNLQQVKLAHAIYDKLKLEDFDHWFHYNSCLVHKKNLDDDDEPSELDLKFVYNGFGPLNRDFTWNARNKIISWRNTHTKNIEKCRIPQIVDAESIWAGMCTPDFQDRWAEQRHVHEAHHQLSGTVCDAWLDGPQTFHLTQNTVDERTLTLYTHLAKKGSCSCCSKKGPRCTNCRDNTCSPKNRVIKPHMKAKSSDLTMSTKLKLSGDFSKKKSWSLKEKEKLWDVIQTHVDKVANGLTTSTELATVTNSIFISSNFDNTGGQWMGKKERDAFFLAHRIGLCYETNAELSDPWKRIMKK